MDPPPVLIEDVTKVIAMSWADLQTLGRIGRINKRYNKIFCEMILCSPKALPQCFLALQKDLDRATSVLQFYAREYKKEAVQENRAYDLFCHIFNYHEDERIRDFAELNNFLNPVLTPFMPACISWYASGTAQFFNPTDTEVNSRNLHSLLKKPICGIKTFLLGNPSFDILWNGCNDIHPDELAYKSCSDCGLFLPDHLSIFELLFDEDKKTIARALELGCQNMAWNNVMQLAIHYAKKYSWDSMIRHLLQKNYDKSMQVRWDIYHDALFQNAYAAEVIDILFADDLQARCVFDKTIYYTLLSYAVCHKKIFAIRYLLAKGANPNEIGCLGTPLLHDAYDSAEITAMLIQAGADVNITNENGSTALLILPQRYEWNKKREEVLRVLLCYKADVNKQDNKGKTVLHYFANLKEKYNGVNCDEAFKMIALLLEHGARITIMDNKGLTALDYACRRNNEYAIKVICDHNKKKIISSVCMVVAFIAVGYFMLPTYWF